VSISYTNYLYSICEQLKAIIIAEFPRFGAKNRLLFKKLNIVDLAEVKFRFLNNMVKCLRISNNKYIIAESVLDSISDSDFWLYDKSVDRYLNVDSACVNISNPDANGDWLKIVRIENVDMANEYQIVYFEKEIKE